MIEERDNRKIMELFKKLIQASYGRDHQAVHSDRRIRAALHGAGHGL
jgi:hypothetical protein